MADQTERIVLEVDDRQAISATKQANAQLLSFEKTGETANKKLEGSFDSLGKRIVSVTDRSRSSIERMVASAEKRAAAVSKSPVERLIAERAQALQRVAGDPQAVERVTRSFNTLIAAQKEGTTGAQRFAEAIRNPFQAAGNAAQGFISKVGLVGVAIGGAVVGIGYLAKAAFDLVTGFDKAVDQTIHLGDRLGITAQEADQLRRMAELVGVSVGAFESSLRLLAEALTAGSEEGKRGREVLRDLGVEAFDSRGKLLPLNVLFGDIGSSLSRIEDAAERTSKATKLFGRGALQLIPLFKDWEATQRRVGKGLETDIQQELDEANNKIQLLKFAWRDLQAVFATKIVAHVEFVTGGIARGAELGEAARRAIFGFPEAPAPKPPGAEFAQGVTDAESVRRGNELVRQFEARQARTEEGLQRQLTEAKQKAEEARQKVIPNVLEPVAQERIAAATAADARVRQIEAQIKAIKERGKTDAEATKFGEAIAKQSLARRLKDVEEFEKEFTATVAEEIKRREQQEQLFAERRAQFETETRAVHAAIIAEREQQDAQALDRSRDMQLRQLDTVNARTVEEQQAVAQRKLEIEIDYLRQSEALQLARLARETQAAIAEAETRGALLFEAQEAIEARIASIREAGAVRAKSISDAIAAQADSERLDLAVKQTQILNDQVNQRFDDMKRGFEGLFDAAFTRARSFTDALKQMFFASFLTPVKEALANLFASLFTGQPAPGAQRRGGAFASILGSLGIGGGGIATPPFLPSQGGTRGGGGGGLLGGLNVQSLGNLREFAGLGSSISTGPGAATTFQASSFGQKLGAFGKSDAAGLAGFALAADGLRRGGKLGIAETTGGGALIGFKFGGPIGAAIGAGIGFGAGLIRSFFKSADQKAREKIKAAYNVDIKDKGVLRQIVAMAQQNFGGNLDLAIRHDSVRELIDLYAQSTGQNNAGISPSARQVSLVESGGSISQITSGGGGSGAPSISPLSGLATTGASGGAAQSQLLIQLDGPATVALLRGEAVQAMAANPRQVQAASIRATRASSGRKELVGLQLSPGTLTA